MGLMDTAHGEGEEWRPGNEQYVETKMSWVGEFEGIEVTSQRALGQGSVVSEGEKGRL